MAKEIPYFKFNISEWITGDITLETFEMQGLFINICAYYWSKDCDLSLLGVKKKFRGYEGLIDALVECNCIKEHGPNIHINFLDEQFENKKIQALINKENGSKGGRPELEKTEKKPNGLLVDNRNDNRNITNIDKSIEEVSKDTKGLAEKEASFIKVFNDITGRKFEKFEKKGKRQFYEIIKSGHTKGQIKHAVKMALFEMTKKGTQQYLTPEFITRPEEFSKYQNMKEGSTNDPEFDYDYTPLGASN